MEFSRKNSQNELSSVRIRLGSERISSRTTKQFLFSRAKRQMLWWSFRQMSNVTSSYPAWHSAVRDDHFFKVFENVELPVCSILTALYTVIVTSPAWKWPASHRESCNNLHGLLQSAAAQSHCEIVVFERNVVHLAAICKACLHDHRHRDARFSS